jgi:hypothetical protein
VGAEGRKTQLLVLAERTGLRIHEVPVDWIDDTDSRVDLAATALADLHGIARLGRALATRALPLAALRTQLGRPPAPLKPLDEPGTVDTSAIAAGLAHPRDFLATPTTPVSIPP